MTTEFFNGISPVEYKGAESSDPLSYRYYNPDEIVLGKRMELLKYQTFQKQCRPLVAPVPYYPVGAMAVQKLIRRKDHRPPTQSCATRLPQI